MVVFHVGSGRSEFLFTASVSTCNDSLIRSLCRVHNLRLRLAALSDALEELGHSNVAKSLQEQGLDTEGASDKERGQFNGVYRWDRVSSELPDVLVRVAADAKMALNSKTQVARRVCIEENELLEKLQNIRKAVSMAFPMGLPSGDPVKRMLDADDVEEALASTLAVLDVMPEDTAELWWAGKQFLRDQYVRDLTGEHEKSTLLVNLQKHENGAPSRMHDVSLWTSIKR
ncbi:unnamed protein product [Peronospora destructor]|uniref:Uncharacterized protein n=1 Tax=Peronospora destructor TaxID=86335 RepID=A0AAV0V5D6_9STRA|nr:unnamed protein product [Peronospora destructor]